MYGLRKMRKGLPWGYSFSESTTVQLIGSKWKLLIMRNLLARPWCFNELRKDLRGISQKVLADSLRSMTYGQIKGIFQRSNRTYTIIIGDTLKGLMSPTSI